MKKNIFFHDKKNFFSRQKEFLFMKIICGRQFLCSAYWLIITNEKAVFVCLTSPDSKLSSLCVICLTLGI